VAFLAARPVGDVQPVIAGIHQPDAAAFTAQLPVAGSGASTPPGAATPIAASSTNYSSVAPSGG
jgi:hypothetical protein